MVARGMHGCGGVCMVLGGCMVAGGPCMVAGCVHGCGVCVVVGGHVWL